MVILKELSKKNQNQQKTSHENFPACKEININPYVSSGAGILYFGLSLHHRGVGEMQKVWRVCVLGQARLTLRFSRMGYTNVTTKVLSTGSFILPYNSQ